MRWVPHLALATRLRLAFAVVALAVAQLSENLLTAVPWVLLVTTLDLGATALLAGRAGGTAVRRRQAVAVLGAGAVAAGAGMAFGGLGGKALVLIPAYHAGLRFGRRGALWATGTGALTAYVLTWAGGRFSAVEANRIGLFVLGGIVFGLLGAWSHHIDQHEAEEDRGPSLAAEASLLLRRLHEVADSLDTGFDAPGSAEMALQDLAEQLRSARSAVLVGSTGERPVPLAIRGVDRTPWPDPSAPGSLLWRTWHTGEPLLGLWDGDGERSVVAVPLHSDGGGRLGMLVLDRAAATPFTDDDLASVKAVAARHSANIELSVLFASLRERAGLEERERLAREMHDGIAQEIVALGFGIDSLRRTARRDGLPIADQLDNIRAELSRVLADLRQHIGDLRIAVRPETGLGAMIGGRLQSFGSTAGITTRMALNETGFRLPAHTEVLIYRLFLRLLVDARHSLDATEVGVELNVAAPRVELTITHNGSSHLTQRDFEDTPLASLGGEVTVAPYGLRGVSVKLKMRSRTGAASATLLEERIPQPS